MKKVFWSGLLIAIIMMGTIFLLKEYSVKQVDDNYKTIINRKSGEEITVPNELRTIGGGNNLRISVEGEAGEMV